MYLISSGPATSALDRNVSSGPCIPGFSSRVGNTVDPGKDGSDVDASSGSGEGIDVKMPSSGDGGVVGKRELSNIGEDDGRRVVSERYDGKVGPGDVGDNCGDITGADVSA